MPGKAPQPATGSAPSSPAQTHASVRLRIHGKVQGVYFRESTRAEAERLRVSGWVRNQPDGTVEALFEGPAPAVAALEAWCHHGPEGARVDAVERLPPGLAARQTSSVAPPHASGATAAAGASGGDGFRVLR